MPVINIPTFTCSMGMRFEEPISELSLILRMDCPSHDQFNNVSWAVEFISVEIEPVFTHYMTRKNLRRFRFCRIRPITLITVCLCMRVHVEEPYE
jgi:hypothetical protein